MLYGAQISEKNLRSMVYNLLSNVVKYWSPACRPVVRISAHEEGTGLSLYKVKKMLENAGGTIEVESRLGEDSTFRVHPRK